MKILKQIIVLSYHFFVIMKLLFEKPLEAKYISANDLNTLRKWREALILTGIIKISTYKILFSRKQYQ